MSKYIKKHRAWQSYANAMLDKGKQPIKFKDYNKSNTRTSSIKSQLKAAGINWDKDKPTAKLKRKKK